MSLGSFLFFMEDGDPEGGPLALLLGGEPEDVGIEEEPGGDDDEGEVEEVFEGGDPAPPPLEAEEEADASMDCAD